MRLFDKSRALDDVCYDIRGPVLDEAKRLENDGFKVLKLNTGNPAHFGLYAPDEVLHDVIVNLQDAQGYCDSQGLFAARKAVMHDFQLKGVMDVGVDDVWTGNGVSELIMMAMQALLNSGDEVLVPAPDYPLWTAAITLCGGKAVHYVCDEASDWQPDLRDMEGKVSARTKAIVVINPNNPTGAVYERAVLEGIARIAREHELIVYADEIYERIVYDDAAHTPMATVDPSILTVSFNGLSKTYRAAGFRSGWMALSGNKRCAAGYREGLAMLANMRLCANVPAQFAIQTALGGYQSIREYILPGGRLLEQRNAAVAGLRAIPGVSVVAPRGALYCFPKLDVARFAIASDERFVLDFLRAEHILLVHGTGFNWKENDHFRLVFLPEKTVLERALASLAGFLETYRQTEG
ncbi:MAG: pyridoxal phosphate-dependent aminotransferase [Spirochaetaceae bacterium]|jgi:alanine-synthesizing transaminase|nr:pyridoxal phosphate-dependent aminotransferase [Spirochaetaceae bacterium]